MRTISISKLKAINSYRGRFTLLMGVVALVLVLVVVLAGSAPSPISKVISNAVAFPIYYPDPNRLPANYTLNQNSIMVVKPGVVIFNVAIAGQKQNIVFSEEVRPSDATMNSFLANYIPLHTDFNTPLGSASVGAYNDGNEIKSVISLPINNGPWIIVTAPGSISNAVFESVVNALVKN